MGNLGWDLEMDLRVGYWDGISGWDLEMDLRVGYWDGNFGWIWQF